MSAVLILAPAIIAGWPAITAAVAGAAAAMGMSIAREVKEEREYAEKKRDQVTRVELDMEQSEILESSVTAGDQIVLAKDDMTVRISRDEYGQLRFHVDGINRSRRELERFGRQVMEKVTQTYVYNRLVTELKRRNIEVMSEEVTEDKSVHIYVRNILE